MAFSVDIIPYDIRGDRVLHDVTATGAHEVLHVPPYYDPTVPTGAEYRHSHGGCTRYTGTC